MAGTLVANTINTDTGLFSTNNAYTGIAKAWVAFQGGSGNTAGVITGSFNVSSITVNGTGLYQVNFATALSNANYAPILTVNDSASGSSNGTTSRVVSGTAPTTSAFSITTNNASFTAYNTNMVYAAVFSS
jgi:hypothetical protein